MIQNRNFSTFSPILTKIDIFFENVDKIEIFPNFRNNRHVFRKFWPKSKFFENLTKIEIFRKFSKILTKIEMFFEKFWRKVKIFRKLWPKSKFFENLTKIEKCDIYVNFDQNRFFFENLTKSTFFSKFLEKI